MKWVQRVIAILAGLVGLVILLVNLFGSATLPACDASETQQLLRQLAMQSVSPFVVGKPENAKAVQDSIQLSGFKEVSFDEEKQVRRCAAVLDLTTNNTTVFDKLPITYGLSWQNRDESKFQVQLDASQ